MLPRGSLLALCLSAIAKAQESSQVVETLSGSASNIDGVPTGSEVTYLSLTSTKLVSETGGNLVISGTVSASTTGIGDLNQTASTTTTPSFTLLVGGDSTSLSGTATQTTTTAQPTNTQPCNNYPEFCERQYSNVTEVCAHNSPFVRQGNAASNQQLDVTSQLNDGIRMLQGQTHMVNGSLHYCHSSCDLLDAGTVEDYLRTVATWVKAHPYDVVTILIGNADFLDVEAFVDPIQNSGLGPYLYEPHQIPMGIEDWPTLSYMILRQKRVVIFMDYKANQDSVPYILDEFSQLWETPFSPTDVQFPCTVERPPGLSDDQARNRLYMANHNLNTLVSIAGISLLIPNTVAIADTNGVNGTGSLGLASENCAADWGRPPNFLLVDYYNRGSPINGSVFQVAAAANNVTYNRECCGKAQSGANRVLGISSLAVIASFCGFLAFL